jgi:hypothetical protein
VAFRQKNEILVLDFAVFSVNFQDFEAGATGLVSRFSNKRLSLIQTLIL